MNGLAIMHCVVLEHISPMRGIELKNQLIADGLIQHTDFEWEYHAPKYINDGFSAVAPRMVIFNFQNAPTATFYQLKWA
jgi:hypothetical protein